MQLTEELRKEPYNFVADNEYYNKGYRMLVGVPGRVLQAKEISALSMFPIYALNDIASQLFSEGVVQGFETANDSKLESGALFGTSTEHQESIEEYKVFDIDPDTDVETEVPVDYSLLEEKTTAEETEETEETGAEETEVEETVDEENKPYTVEIYHDTGDENWPKNII